MGKLNLNYGCVGSNSELIMHFFQNKIAHEYLQSQRQFEMINDNLEPKLNLSTYYQSQYSIWGN